MVRINQPLEQFCAHPSSSGFRLLPEMTKRLLVSFARLCLRDGKGRQDLIKQIIYFAAPRDVQPLPMSTIRVLYSSIYDNNFAPPKWTRTEYDSLIEEFGDSAFVIAPGASDPKNVSILVTQRVPVNIAMKEFFNHELLERYFGYRMSGYTSQWKRDKVLPPNIGVYTRTPIQPHRSDSFPAFIAHVYNAIGYGFDSRKQADWKALIQHSKSPGMLEESLRNLYKGVFERVFSCAHIVGVESIAMCYVGCGAFAELYNEDGRNLTRDVWEPAFFEIHASHPNINVTFLGEEAPEGYRAMGYIPGAFASIDPHTTLYVNAWDPHSVPGNGNAQDNSLDGQFGRRSAIGILGWGASNPKLLDNVYFVGRA